MSNEISDIEAEFLQACHDGDLAKVKEAVAAGCDVNVAAYGGLTGLHLATGRNCRDIVQFLVEEAGAAFLEDGFDRYPSGVAAQCRVSDALYDYVCDKEVYALARAKLEELGNSSLRACWEGYLEKAEHSAQARDKVTFSDGELCGPRTISDLNAELAGIFLEEVWQLDGQDVEALIPSALAEKFEYEDGFVSFIREHEKAAVLKMA